jgi:hypothetical protein
MGLFSKFTQGAAPPPGDGPPPPPAPPSQPPGSGGDGSKWKRWHKILLGVVGVLIVIIVLTAIFGSDNSDEGPTAAATTESASEPATATPAPATEAAPTTEAAPAPPPEPRAPPAISRSGVGAKVETFRLSEASPVVLEASHNGSSNFSVILRGGGNEDLLVNTIGDYSGRTLASDVSPGRYRLQIDADGPWSVELTQPVARSSAKRVPGTVQGRGDSVIPLRAVEDLEPIVTGSHQGEGNFAVTITGIGDITGQELLFNEIGNFSGQTITTLPEGGYLLAVTADGPWKLRFQR